MRNNKLFVQTMIVSAVIGLTILMAMMFIGVKWLLDKEEVVNVQPSEVRTSEKKVEAVVFNSNILGIIVGQRGQELTIFDTNKEQYITVTIEQTTRVTNAEGKIMPSNKLVLGDVVELIYEPQKNKLIGVSIAKEVWQKQDLRNTMIDRADRTIKIGSKVYKYTDNTLVLNRQGEEISIDDIGDHDALALKGIGNELYSIQVVRGQGYIELSNIPLYKGVLEIDTKRHIPLVDEMQSIAVSEGKHKVVLQMDGYESVIGEIEVEAGETVVFDAGDAKKRYTTVKLQVLNEGLDYQVAVGNKTYMPNEEIRVLSGKYPIKVSAEGYEEWVSHIILEEEEVIIQIRLIEKEKESSETQEGQGEIGEEAGEDEVEDYSINISTSPSDAKVYIDGEYKGNTPFKTMLEVGEYDVTLKKEGYETYTTNILIDHSDTQNTYMYILIPTR